LGVGNLDAVRIDLPKKPYEIIRIDRFAWGAVWHGHRPHIDAPRIERHGPLDGPSIPQTARHIRERLLPSMGQAGTAGDAAERSVLSSNE
jgi:hypothetical protein